MAYRTHPVSANNRALGLALSLALVGWAPHPYEVQGPLGEPMVGLSRDDADRVLHELETIRPMRARISALEDLARLQGDMVRTATTALAEIPPCPAVEPTPIWARPEVWFIAGIVVGGVLAAGLARSVR